MTHLESRMILQHFMCEQFGHYNNLRDILNRLDNLPRDFMSNDTSRFAQVIAAHISPQNDVKRDELARYDANIIAHSQALGMTNENDRSWKPFQYLALLFTERYLDLYFQDQSVLIEKLNGFLVNQRAYQRTYRDIPEYTDDDIHTLAFQSATGSGKTLLLHANILQYKHYLEANKELHTLNKIILVTPDEGLSRQHLRELQSSKIPARLFSDQQETTMLSSLESSVEIIDLHKLDNKKGVKRVDLKSFEENNLVMVDEGHLGTGGKVWRGRRKQLAKNGFTFEYSATFNQAVSGSGDEIKQLRNEYGKSILFDYSYKFFYQDGYGKDYQISNMQKTDDGEVNNLYLLACLLVFYQQCQLYSDKAGQWRAFNVAPPLWVFLGKTVTGGNRQIETDVVKIIRFLAWVMSERQQVTTMIGQLIGDNAGLIDENGTEIFSQSFSYIKDKLPAVIYDDLRDVIFHGKGQLHVSHLTGMDELQLAVGDANPFGVVNVGKAGGLYVKLKEVKDRQFHLSKNAFAQPLFADVDKQNSPVNIVVGARKFAAGWNSWRVSTMGLMHVGTGEGPQIIQMFGRGVRLKGHALSLKRHTALAGVNKPDEGHLLTLLETLNIFGLKANYMDKFKDYLGKEGIKVDRVVFSLPTKKQFSNVKGLKIIKKRESAGEFQYSNEFFDLPARPEPADMIELDRYQHLQTLQSQESQTPETTAGVPRQTLGSNHLSWINKKTIYHKVLQRKRRLGWHNMTISQNTVNTLLEQPDWYELYISPEKLEASGYKRVREWENLAVDLICEYADKHWRRQRSIWENKFLEAAPLNDENLNYVEEYEISVDAKEAKLIKRIEKLIEQVANGEYEKEIIEEISSGHLQLSLLAPSFHAYKPLLYVNQQEAVKVTPVCLNGEERKLVEYLKQVIIHAQKVDSFLAGKEIYLMRNLTHGKGVSFFDDFSFYPDFILWVKDSKRQDILFIDPKGLQILNRKTRSKIDLHTRIKETQARIQKKHPKLFLHSYIWSHTRPKDIDGGNFLSYKECHKLGIFISDSQFLELIELLEDACQQDQRSAAQSS